jgi:hypothetical protein
MSKIIFSTTIEPPWTNIEPIRLGTIPTGLGTADRFLTVTTDEGQRLRIDLYASGENRTFEEAHLWGDNLVIGYGHRLHFIQPTSRKVISIDLGGYFGHLYPTDECMLVASEDRLIRIEPDGKVGWLSEHLGIDGVVVNRVADGLIEGEGEGEWDPPGGWRPFRIRLDSGEKA